MSELKKILVVQTASIGDVILTTPLIEKLHASYPKAQIDILVKKGNESLFSGHPYLKNILIWNKKEHKYRNLLDLINAVREQKYDLLVNVQRFFTTGLIALLSKAKKTVGFNKNPLSLFFTVRIKHLIGKKGEGIHEIDRNHKLIESWTDDKSGKMKLYPSQKNMAKMSSYKTHKYICIAPTSLWFTKQYPIEKWIAFLKNIDPNLYVYFLGAPVDARICQQIIIDSKHANCLNLSGKLSFLESAALMKDADMNFVNDSAPMHLASAVNAPITVLYCSTVPDFGFGPLSDDSKVIEVDEALDCRPCGLHGHRVCPKKHFKCALNIDTKRLLDRLK